MKLWLLINLAIFLVLGTAAQANAPIGVMRKFLRIQVYETERGTDLQEIWYLRFCREVSSAVSD